MWGSDFPHQESDWPESLKIIDKNFAGVPEEDKQKMACGNAVEFFRLNCETTSVEERSISPRRHEETKFSV